MKKKKKRKEKKKKKRKMANLRNLFKKSKKREKKNLVKTLIFLAVIFLTAFLIYFSGAIKPTCYDEQCFNESFQECQPAKYTRIRNNDMYEYKIYRSIGSECRLKISMKKSAPGTDMDIRDAIEGKSMKCKIPKELMKSKSIDEFDNLIDYCTGHLKEGMYQVMLNRMYGLIVSQMGDVVGEMEKVLKGV